MIKKYLPKNLLGRSLLIIVVPLILLQLVSGTIFYEAHWHKVALRLARSVAGDVAAVTHLIQDSPGQEQRAKILRMASEDMGLAAQFKENMVLKSLVHKGSGLTVKMLDRAMGERILTPYRIDTETLDRGVIVDIQLQRGVLNLMASRKRLFSSTVYVFVLWMIGTSLILFGVATIFMRNQVKPIRRLASAAENFGKGRDDPVFKPEGANEVRQAAQAFIAMRERILVQIRQRTDMLAGVSHDLRTPLTRMRLELEMLDDTEVTKNLKSDITEMEHMLEAYLSFARGEGHEKPILTDLCLLVNDIVLKSKNEGRMIRFNSEKAIMLPLRINAIKRSITNILNNAKQYANNVFVRIDEREKYIEILVDDDGPGIPEGEWVEVFKPFYRLEHSRNTKTGGVGLGLTIVRDIIRGHGGDVVLGKAPAGGLRVNISLPI